MPSEDLFFKDGSSKLKPVAVSSFLYIQKGVNMVVTWDSNKAERRIYYENGNTRNTDWSKADS